MTLASKITLVRVAMIPAFMVTMYLSGGTPGLWMYISLTIFIVASLTDSLDGYIARHYNQVTDFGKFLDPLADKLLVIAAMCMFCQWGVFPAWALMIVLTREFAVTGLRLIAVQKGHVIAAGWSGKVKTASTTVWLCSTGSLSASLSSPRFTPAWNILSRTGNACGAEKRSAVIPLRRDDSIFVKNNLPCNILTH